MKKILLAAFVSSLSTFGFCDEFYDGVEGICTENNYVIEYFGAYNEEGLKQYETRATRSQKECKLGNSTYRLLHKSTQVSAKGMCGGYEKVYIIVEKDGKEIFNSPAVADCWDVNEYISKVTFYPVTDNPVVTTIHGSPW